MIDGCKIFARARIVLARLDHDDALADKRMEQLLILVYNGPFPVATE